MAHFKRGKCRRHGRISFTSTATTLKRLGFDLAIPSGDGGRRWRPWPTWVRGPMGNTPAKWNREMHARPHRARTRAMARKVLIGMVEPDEALWPDSRKPQRYFW